MLPSEASALARNSRYCTPEPTNMAELPEPSAPRAQPRLRIKRRNITRATGPTDAFLASVAAADVPIPSIEFPDAAADCEMVDAGPAQMGNLSPLPRPSPPRTPMPGQSSPYHGDGYRRTDWYASTPDTPDRPSSSHSDPSNWSDDSYFSGNNTMRSNGTICTSPDSEMGDPFISTPQKEAVKEARNKHSLTYNEVYDATTEQYSQVRGKKYVESRWTKDQSDHLLRTYHLYLQDPTVTPFRMENSRIPPEGIVRRVSKEAKRSWKGPKPKKQSKIDKGKERQYPGANLTVESAYLAQPNSDAMDFARGRSPTPTGDAPKAYIKWAHSGAATRSHLRQLCKYNYDQSAQMYMYLQGRSTTPFSHTRDDDSTYLLGEARAPADTQPFSTKSIALSLATSASETMQLGGPLARLAQSPPLNTTTSIRDFATPPTRRLGSPFAAKTYGPQSSRPHLPAPSSKSLASTLRPSTLTGTQKRRAMHDPEDTPFSRPSILSANVFGPPVEPTAGQQQENDQRRVRSRGYTVNDASVRSRDYALFAPRSINFASPANDVFGPEPSPGPTSRTQSARNSWSRAAGSAALLPPPVFRLNGTGRQENSTFPRRGHGVTEVDVVGGVRWSTFHNTGGRQARHSIESFDFAPSPMRARLAQMGERIDARDRSL
ncbi:hypothetical protein VE03_09425 [Pseudogymnoascus sp. 23342-1-I1]|nr:hypothetical protein VE03_09425 [Pseudogymnoascus sp. 23342-1-I1]